MSTKDQLVRICLTGKSIEDLKAMLADLKSEPGTAASLSELAAWAIESFYQTGYSQQKHAMVKRFTSVKKLLRDTASAGKSDAEIISILSSIVRAKKKETQSEVASKNDKTS